jgi:hypothetical protein
MRRCITLCTVAYVLIGLGSASILHAQRGTRIRIVPHPPIEGRFSPEQRSKINGWGIDSEPEDAPAERNPDSGRTLRSLYPPGGRPDPYQVPRVLDPDWNTISELRPDQYPVLLPIPGLAVELWKAHAPPSEKQREAIAREHACTRDFPWSEEARAAFFSELRHEWTAKLSGELRTAIYSAIEKIQTSSWLADLKQLPEKEYLDAKAGVSNKEIFAALRRRGDDPGHN